MTGLRAKKFRTEEGNSSGRYLDLNKLSKLIS
jgi:hypothetical protein